MIDMLDRMLDIFGWDRKKLEQFIFFGFVGGLGTIVNTGMLWLLTEQGMFYIFASILATELAIVFNFFGNHFLTFRKKSNGTSTLRKFMSFQAISLITIVGTVTILWLLTRSFGQELLLVWNLIAILVMFAANFFLNHSITWGEKRFSQVGAAGGKIMIIMILLVLVAMFSVQVAAQSGNSTGNNTGNNTGNSSGNVTNSTPANGFLNITSVPSGASIFLDDLSVSQTPGFLEVTPSTYNVTLRLAGYTEYSEIITVGGNETEAINAVLQELDLESKAGTDLGMENGNYHMFADETATFTIDEDTTVTWKVNGAVQETTTGASHEYEWEPGVLYTGNRKQATVTASTPLGEVDWIVMVEYVINPFFSSLNGKSDVQGTKETQFHVFTNDDAIIFDRVEVEFNNLKDPVELIAKPHLGEVDWYADLMDLPAGNLRLEKITGYAGNDTVIYEFNGERGHYVAPTSDDDDENPTISSVERLKLGIGLPELVYAVFSQDVIGTRDSQEVRIDAKDFDHGVRKAQAVIKGPDDSYRIEEMEISQGNPQYGTWSASFKGFKPGKYILEEINLWGDLPQPVTNRLTDRSFYVTGDATAGSYEQRNLMIVYSVLDRNVVENGSDVVLRLDAIDHTGIEQVFAEVSMSRGGSFTMPLELVEGNQYYGTWEANLKAENPDTTYTFTSVTLQNSEEKNNIKIEGRSFYVEALEGSEIVEAFEEEEEMSFFSKHMLLSLWKDPLFPTILAFAMMIVVVAVWMAAMKLRNVLEA